LTPAKGESVEATVTRRDAARGWVKVFRDPPFYLVGVLPFSLGTLLAVRDGHTMVWGVWALGSIALALIMAMTFLINEYFDYETDVLNEEYNKFSGGSRSLPQGLVERRKVLMAAGVCTVIALVLGLILQFGYDTGPLTLPFGALAAVIGYAYTGPPFRLIYRGLGELMIGISVGWMPVVIGYYLLGGIPTDPYVHLMSLPIAISIVMVIVANEFPDYESDKASGKGNLTVRLGRERTAWIFALLGLSFAASMIYIGFTYFEGWRLWILTLPLLLSFVVSWALSMGGAWTSKKRLQQVCLATILLNLSTIVLLMVVNW
jgi:1,4-dihydroxy-2-naphthoate octaprenyltransferase